MGTGRYIRGMRELERCGQILRMAERKDRPGVSVADERVGVCCVGHDHILSWEGRKRSSGCADGITQTAATCCWQVKYGTREAIYSAGCRHTRSDLRNQCWGLYDMHGNVWEWCNDWHSKNIVSYNSNPPMGNPIWTYFPGRWMV